MTPKQILDKHFKYKAADPDWVVGQLVMAGDMEVIQALENSLAKHEDERDFFARIDADAPPSTSERLLWAALGAVGAIAVGYLFWAVVAVAVIYNEGLAL